MPPRAPLLTRAECTALKGLAIVGIALHNYLHVQRGYLQENEYTFVAERWAAALRYFSHPTAQVVQQAFSFAGHYGVAIFLFLTGYGLVQKYEQRGGAPLRRWSFIGQHYLKLLRLMAIPFVVAEVAYAWMHGRFTMNAGEAVAQLLMCHTLLPSPNYYPGPFWYFALAMQAYLLYALVLYRPGGTPAWRSNLVMGLLVAACYLYECSLAPDGKAMWMCHVNLVGNLPPLVAGIVCGRSHGVLSRRQGACVAIVALAAWGAMNSHVWLWLWLPLVSAALGVGLVKAIPALTCRAVTWTGQMSAWIFAVHAIARLLLEPLNRHHATLGLVAFVALTLLLAMGYRRLAALLWSRRPAR